MKTTLSTFNNRKTFYFSFLVYLLALPNLMAQDPGIDSILEPGPVVFANQTTPIEVVVTNSDPAIQANNVVVIIQVLDLSFSPVFFHEGFIPVIPPSGSVNLSTLPDLWYPDSAGDYLVQVDIFPEIDVDPTNNSLQQPVMAQPQPPIQIEQINMVEPYFIPNSLYGNFCIDFPPINDPLFVNVIAADPFSTGEDWVVQNMPLLPFHSNHTLCYWFDLGLLGFSEGDDVTTLDFSMRLDSFTLDAPFPDPQFLPIPVSNLDYYVPSDNPTETIELPPTNGTLPTYTFNEQVTWLYRGCDVPNIDLDSVAHPPSPTYAGDLNACGPASAANSMQWLEDTHPLIPATAKTHRQKMESISKHMGRGDREGVTTTQMVQGKLGYIDECMLPIHVKYQSVFITDSTIASPNGSFGHKGENKGSTTTPKPPTWEFLKSEMEKGEDVEIMFGWYDKSANRHGGHWVTVTGVSETASGVKGIYIKDDDTQEGPGGASQHYHNWETDGDWSRLLGYDGPNNYCWVESVVSESYDPTITYFVFDFNLDWMDFTLPNLSPDPLTSLFTFSFPSSSDTSYLNILANLPDSNEVWMAQNVLLPPRDTIEEVSLWWDLADLGMLPGQSFDSVHLKLTVDNVVRSTPVFIPTYELDIPIDTTDYIVGDGVTILAPRTTPYFSIFSSLPFDSTKATKFVYRGCEVPNIDLDSTTNNPTTMPGYAGDLNACAPASAANSLHWLEGHPNIPDSLTHREKLKELSGMMGRMNNGATAEDDFIKGKLAYIDKYKLPIHVKFQNDNMDTSDIASPDTLYGHVAENKNDSAFAKPTWDWLYAEMEAGEDVELQFGRYDSTGARINGHFITITGVVEIGGKKRIYYKDDTDQWNKGGMRHQCATWNAIDSLQGKTYLPELSSENRNVVVEGVVSESYDPSITFCPDDMTLDQASIPSGTYTASDTIYISGTIESGSDVILSAPNIVWLPHSLVEVGATVLTDAVGCP